MPKKVLFIFGTRPEAIKVAPLIHQLKKDPKTFSIQVCVTAQHRQMLDQILRWFDIVPDMDLDVMRHDQDLYSLTAEIVSRLKDIITSAQPDVVLVQGDTTTAMAGAMAAFYAKVPVGHIEAGLRTGNMLSPFPEEFNRRVVGITAAYHFAPTYRAKKNLLMENTDERTVYVTGNTVIDALRYSIDKIDRQHHAFAELQGIDFSRPVVTVTTHRRENFGDRLECICTALRQLSERHSDHTFVCPVHRNPNVRSVVHTHLADCPNICLLEPLDYAPFIYLINKSSFVITDSGGVQEEAPSLGKPVLVLRDETERPEAVIAGTVKLIGADMDKIVSEASRLIQDHAAYDKMSKAVNPYGDGKASERISRILAGSSASEFKPGI